MRSTEWQHAPSTVKASPVVGDKRHAPSGLRRRLGHLALASALGFLWPFAANATDAARQATVDSEVVEYIVAPGDTLYGIGAAFLRDDLDWRYLRAFNQLDRDGRIRPGQRLRIPATWLRQEELGLTVESVSGEASVGDRALTAGASIRELEHIQTGAEGVVVVRLPDGTRMQIAPGSTVHVERLRRYFGSDALEARIRLERGGIESHTPEPTNPPASARSGAGSVAVPVQVNAPAQPSRRPSGSLVPPGAESAGRSIQIRTPKAVAAVRGTHFRVQEDDRRASSGVLAGLVSFGNAGTRVELPADFGASADASGQVTPPEPLLPPPVLDLPTQAQSIVTVRVPFTPVPRAAAYRVRVASDPAFTQDLTETVTTDPAIMVASQRDGIHHVSVRAISPTGVEGRDATGELRFAARPVAPALSDPAPGGTLFANTVTLGWLRVPQADGYSVQVARDPDFRDLVTDERTAENRLTVALPAEGVAPRVFHWRIASVAQDRRGPWSASQSFQVRELAPGANAEVGESGTRIAWQAMPDARYLVIVSPLDPGGTPTQEIATEKPEIMIPNLAPARYEVRIVTEFAGGQRSPPGEPQTFTIPLLLRDGFGNPVQVDGKPSPSLFQP